MDTSYHPSMLDLSKMSSDTDALLDTDFVHACIKTMMEYEKGVYKGSCSAFWFQYKKGIISFDELRVAFTSARYTMQANMDKGILEIIAGSGFEVGE